MLDSSSFVLLLTLPSLACVCMHHMMRSATPAVVRPAADMPPLRAALPSRSPSNSACTLSRCLSTCFARATFSEARAAATAGRASSPLYRRSSWNICCGCIRVELPAPALRSPVTALVSHGRTEPPAWQPRQGVLKAHRQHTRLARPGVRSKHQSAKLALTKELFQLLTDAFLDGSHAALILIACCVPLRGSEV